MAKEREEQQAQEVIIDAKTQEAVQAACEAAKEAMSAGIDPHELRRLALNLTVDDIGELATLPLPLIARIPAPAARLVWHEVAKQTVENLARRLEQLGNPNSADLMEPQKKIAATEYSSAVEAIYAEMARALLLDDEAEALRIWRKLIPYFDALAIDRHDLFDKPDASAAEDVVKEAARMARKDGKKIPVLKAERLKTEREQERRKRLAAAHKRRAEAEKAGSVTGAQYRLKTIANKSMGFDLFTANVLRHLPESAQDLVLDEQGKIDLYDLTTHGETPAEEVLQEVGKVQTAFLLYLLTLADKNNDIREKNSRDAIMPVYLPDFFEQAGIDPRPREWDGKTKKLKPRNAELSRADARLDAFMKFINPLRNMAAWFGDDLYLMAGFHSYHKETETVYVTAPYMFKIIEVAKLKAGKHSALTAVFRADILNENPTAVEVANRITEGLILRGVSRADRPTAGTTRQREKKLTKTIKKPDGTTITETLTFEVVDARAIVRDEAQGEVAPTLAPAQQKPEPPTYTYSVQFETLIKACPQLARELDEIRNGIGPTEAAEREKTTKGEKANIEEARRADHKHDSQRTNKKLKDVFAAAVRIIMEKTNIPQYYAGLTVRTGRFDTFKAPTNSTLKDELIITHHGKNPSYTE